MAIGIKLIGPKSTYYTSPVAGAAGSPLGQYNGLRTPPQEEDELGITCWTYDTSALLRGWRFILAAAGGTYAAGNATYYTDTARSIADNRVANVLGSRNNFMGICTYTITAANHGWVQTYGQNLVAKSTGSISAGDMIVPSSADTVIAGVNAGTAVVYQALGVCIVATSSNVTGVYLNVQ